MLNNEEEVDCKRVDEIFEEIMRFLVYKFFKIGSDIIIEYKNDNLLEIKWVFFLKIFEGIIEV